MANYTKKWYLLKCHRRAEIKYSTTGSNDGRPVLISQDLFIRGNSGRLGLAHKHCVFSGFRPSRYLKFWEKEWDEKKLKRKRNDYWHIYEICRKEGYITDQETGLVEINGSPVKYPTVSNEKADNVSGYLGYIEGLLGEYGKTTAFLGTIGSTFIGSGLAVLIAEWILKN